MANEYTATLKINNGGIVDKTFSTMAEALTFCKKFAEHCAGPDFGGCDIINSWADELYNCTRGGIESYFVVKEGYIHEVDSETFKAAYGLK